MPVHSGSDARTIVDLELDFNQVRDVPRRRMPRDAFAEYLRDSDRSAPRRIPSRRGWGGVRMTSPRNTLEAFMANMNAAYAIAMAAQAAHDARSASDHPGTGTNRTGEGRQSPSPGQLGLRSLSGSCRSAPGYRDRSGTVAEGGPRPHASATDRYDTPRRSGRSRTGSGLSLALAGYRNRDRADADGARCRQFPVRRQFGCASADELRGAEGLPYRAEESLALSDFHAAQVTPGFYEFYASTPGYLVPSAHTSVSGPSACRMALHRDQWPDPVAMAGSS